MKRLTALFATVIFAFAVVACNDNKDEPTEAPADSPAATEAAAE